MRARARSRPAATPHPSRAEVEGTLTQALRSLLSDDHHLIAGDAPGRSITFRIGHYLQVLLPTWQVDCAYCLERQTRATAHPDLVVHQRSTTDHLLVIEVKKSSDRSPTLGDTRKLESFLNPPCRYRHAALLIVTTDHSLVVPYELCWVSD